MHDSLRETHFTPRPLLRKQIEPRACIWNGIALPGEDSWIRACGAARSPGKHVLRGLLRGVRDTAAYAPASNSR